MRVEDGRDGLLFEREPEFPGLPEEGFGLFGLEDHRVRRRRIAEVIHPALKTLGEDMLIALAPRTTLRLHAHVPRLDWPRDYRPYCTWLAVSGEPHGYQAGPQLNLGVHADHVPIRLGWDVGATAFGRFEFLCRHGEIGEQLRELARREGLSFRVYATERWPRGSKVVFDSPDDLAGSFNEVQRRGVWWELGLRYDLPGSLELVCSPELGREATRVFRLLLPLYERIEGEFP